MSNPVFSRLSLQLSSFPHQETFDLPTQCTRWRLSFFHKSQGLTVWKCGPHWPAIKSSKLSYKAVRKCYQTFSYSAFFHSFFPFLPFGSNLTHSFLFYYISAFLLSHFPVSLCFLYISLMFFSFLSINSLLLRIPFFSQFPQP